MKHINAFANLDDIRKYILGIGSSLFGLGMLVWETMIISFRFPIEDMTDHRLRVLTAYNTITVSMVLVITICFFIFFKKIGDDKNNKEYFKDNNMKKFLNSYNEVVFFNKIHVISLIIFGFLLLFYCLALINYINVFLANILYFEVPLWAKSIAVATMGSSLILSLLLYIKLWTRSMKSRKEFNETLNEKNFSIGLHKGQELVSAHSISEFLGYIKDGYSCDEEYVKKTLFN